jgi:mRNA interferase MazF
VGLGLTGPRRGNVYLTDLSPTVGHEIRDIRPCAIVSPDEINGFYTTLLIAPMTTGGFRYPFRVPSRFQGREGHVVLDQIRAVDRSRLLRYQGQLDAEVLSAALAFLRQIFED